jgi:hypothetical protein
MLSVTAVVLFVTGVALLAIRFNLGGGFAGTTRSKATKGLGYVIPASVLNGVLLAALEGRMVVALLLVVLLLAWTWLVRAGSRAQG